MEFQNFHNQYNIELFYNYVFDLNEHLIVIKNIGKYYYLEKKQLIITNMIDVIINNGTNITQKDIPCYPFVCLEGFEPSSLLIRIQICFHLHYKHIHIIKFTNE